MRLLLPAMALAALLGCSGGGSSEPEKPACDLTVETLPGRTFVELEALPGNQEAPNPMARIKFAKGESGLTAKYTAKSLGNVYDFTCEQTSGPDGAKQEVACKTEPNVAEACRAIDIHKEGSCSKAKIEEITGWKLDAEADKVIEATKKELAEARQAPTWARYAAIHHHIGNAIQGLVYAKVDQRRCRIQIDDMMKIVYQHKALEDFNPVGTNPFVPSEEDYIFEDCPHQRVLADLTTEALPPVSEIPPERVHAPGEPVHYWYVLDDDSTKAAEGCTYSADLYVNWEPLKKDVPVEVKEGKVAWHAAHTYAEGDLIKVLGKPGAVFHMVRHKTCGEKKEQIDVTCNAATIEG